MVNKQRADKSLTFIQVALFQLLEQLGPLLLGAGSAHQPMAALRRHLVGRRRLIPVGVQLFDGEQPVVLPVGVEGWQQRRTFAHQTHSCMLATVNPPFMPLG